MGRSAYNSRSPLNNSSPSRYMSSISAFNLSSQASSQARVELYPSAENPESELISSYNYEIALSNYSSQAQRPEHSSRAAEISLSPMASIVSYSSCREAIYCSQSSLGVACNCFSEVCNLSCRVVSLALRAVSTFSISLMLFCSNLICSRNQWISLRVYPAILLHMSSVYMYSFFIIWYSSAYYSMRMVEGSYYPPSPSPRGEREDSLRGV